MMRPLLSPDSVFQEIGCGIGRVLQNVAPMCREVYGADISARWSSGARSACGPSQRRFWHGMRGGRTHMSGTSSLAHWQQQVDILPTVADLAGIKVPWTMDGLDQTGKPARTRTDKWWYDIPGHRETRPGPPNWALVLKGTTDTLVRASEGDKGLYRFGAFADLVYRDPASVGAITGDQEATATQDDFKQYNQIKPGSGRIPAMVSGRLTSPLPPAASTVLVAVNGKIGGESKLFPERPGEPAAKFAVITPDTLWKAGDGHRQLQVYIVDRSGGSPRLIPVSLTAG